MAAARSLRLCCLLGALRVVRPTVYQLNFREVRNVPYDGVSIAEVALYGLDGSQIAISAAANPGGSILLPWESADSAIDGTLQYKWYDHNTFALTGSSRLLLTIPDGVTVGSYNLWTANGPERRDPISWDFGILWPNGTVVELSRVDGASPPLARRQPYSSTPFPAISSPPPPSLPPLAPPPPPAGDVYILAFDAVRDSPFDGIQLGEVSLYGADGVALPIIDAISPDD